MLWPSQLPPQVVAQIPPIQVTVQSPPGMPEWIKILITAATGALLGIISNIAMEYVKPWIARRQLRKTVTAQLMNEFRENVSIVAAARRILLRAEHDSKNARDTARQVATVILKAL